MPNDILPYLLLNPVLWLAICFLVTSLCFKKSLGYQGFDRQAFWETDWRKKVAYRLSRPATLFSLSTILAYTGANSSRTLEQLLHTTSGNIEPDMHLIILLVLSNVTMVIILIAIAYAAMVLQQQLHVSKSKAKSGNQPEV